ncbi:hypothetical protein BDZ45DRAFT_749600 [Acephala macrosclerotiorum]|nr:hypothetical protein BDZ45DRAFT_749600 [Acephala macrosclerotiorum]
MYTIFSVLALAVAALAAPVAEPDTIPVLGVTIGSSTDNSTGPNPSQVTTNSISYGGTGSPQGSVGSFISVDRTSFTIIFDPFVASLGAGVALTENCKNCQLNINLQYPSGFQYSVLGTTFRGYADLTSGVSGVQSATYYFSGSSTQASTQTTFRGPTSSDYEVSNSIPFASSIWSSCGAALPLNINSQVRLTGSTTGSGLFIEDSVDGKVEFVVGVQWQKCW